MPKHILIISQYFYPEPFRINDIAKEWVVRGYQVTVITGIPNYPEGKFYEGYGLYKKRKEVYEGIEIIRIPLIPRGSNSIQLIANYFSFVTSGYIWHKLTKIDADLVFTFEVSPMTQALLGAWYSQKKDIPHFLYVQDLWPDNVQIVGGINHPLAINQINRMVDYIYKHSDLIFVTSNSFKDTLANRGVDERKLVYWPQYAEEFENQLFESNLYINPNKFNISYTGNIGTAQGLDLLPKVASLLKENSVTDVCFNIVGDGRFKEEFIKLVVDNNIEAYFNFLGRQTADEIPAYLSQSDAAYLSFADNELFAKTIPAKLQTYLSAGIPILAAARGESEQIVEENQVGFASQPGNVKQLYDNIIKMKNLSEQEKEQMGQNGRAYLKQAFDKPTLMDKMDHMIEMFTK